MSYKHLFDPTAISSGHRQEVATPADRRDGSVYVYDEKTILAVNVALATRRPLLVRGPSGCGKSSLARHAARVLGWRYYERVISSHSQAQDLLWEFDYLRRLQDAQARTLREGKESYIRPGVLWWAFDRNSAEGQARTAGGMTTKPEKLDPSLGGNHKRAVVLLDEIDKADPDVPNNLLVPLGSLQFQVEETGILVETTTERAPLVIITTNEERELPAAFLRRCVGLLLELPDVKRLVQIGLEHFPTVPVEQLGQVAKLLSDGSSSSGEGVLPSPAEYLDTIRAVLELKVKPGSALWKDVLDVTVRKHGRSTWGNA
jgi:MoxR-like ATPase